MSAVSAHLPRRDVTLRMNDIEAHDVHCALAITVQLLQQIGAQPGGDLTPESEDRIATVARRLDHERRHKGAIANPNHAKEHRHG